MGADFSIGWQFGSIGGALWLRRKVVEGGARFGTWLPEGEAFALEIRADFSVWLELLSPQLTATVNGDPVTGPCRLRARDTVIISGPAGRSSRLELQGLRANDTVPPGVVHVEGSPSPGAQRRKAKAVAWLEDLQQPQTLLSLAERWRVRSLKRAAAWLVTRGVPEAAAIAGDARRATVEPVVTTLLAADPPRVAWADALAAFLGIENRLLSEGLSISVSTRGPNVFAVGPEPSAPLAAAREHASLVARDVLSWLAALDPTLADAEAAELEADAAVANDGARDEAEGLDRLLSPEASRVHSGDLHAPRLADDWASDVEVVEGDLVLRGARTRRAAFPSLRAVRGALVVEECTHLVSLDLPLLVAAGSVSVQSNPLLPALELPALEATRGDIVVRGNRFLLELSLPALARATSVQVLYDDALPDAQVSPLLERLGAGVVVHRRNPGPLRNPLEERLGGAWVRPEERAQLLLLHERFPSHPGLAELALFDALLGGAPPEALEAHLARVIALHAGTRVDLSARLLRQALRGNRPLRAERARLAAAVPVPSAERGWSLLADRVQASERRDALVEGLLRRLLGIHLVDALPPSLAAAGAWLEARVAADDAPAEYLMRLGRSAGGLEGLKRLALVRSVELRLLAATVSTWARHHGRGDVLGLEAALLTEELGHPPAEDEVPPSSLLESWLQQESQRQDARVEAERARRANFEAVVEPALAVAAQHLDAAAAVALRAFVHSAVWREAGRLHLIDATWRELFGVRWLMLRSHDRRTLYVGWRDGQPALCFATELLARAPEAAADVEALYLAVLGGGVGTGREAVARAAARFPELAPALDAWRPPWRDDRGAHFFVAENARVAEMLVEPSGRTVEARAWETALSTQWEE